MIFYKDITKRNFTIFTIIFAVAVIAHIVSALLVRNYLYYNTILLITLVVISFDIVLFTLITLKQSINKTNKLYNLLYDKCDPVLAIEEAKLYLDNVITKKNKIVINSFLAICYFRTSNYNEASIIYSDNSINKVKVSVNTKIMWYHNLIMILIKLYDEDNEKRIKDHFKYLSQMYPNKHKKCNEYLEAQDMFKKFMDKDYDGCKRYFELQLDLALSNYEKVIYNTNLAFIYDRLHIDNTNNIEYVLENGNTLNSVEEVKQLKGKVK